MRDMIRGKAEIEAVEELNKIKGNGKEKKYIRCKTNDG